MRLLRILFFPIRISATVTTTTTTTITTTTIISTATITVVVVLHRFPSKFYRQSFVQATCASRLRATDRSSTSTSDRAIGSAVTAAATTETVAVVVGGIAVAVVRRGRGGGRSAGVHTIPFMCVSEEFRFATFLGLSKGRKDDER